MVSLELKEHISSNVHSVRMRFLWHIKKEAEAANRATFVCPYCRLLSEEYQAGTIPTPVQHLADAKSVMRHDENSDRDKIVSSTKDKLKWLKSEQIAKKNDKLKWDAGWYEDDVQRNLPSRKKISTRSQRAEASRLGLMYNEEQELKSPLPHPMIPDTVCGAFDIEHTVPNQLETLGNELPRPGEGMDKRQYSLSEATFLPLNDSAPESSNKRPRGWEGVTVQYPV